MKGNSFMASNKSVIDRNGCDRCFHFKDEFGNCKCSELKVHRRFGDIEKWEKKREIYETKEKMIKELE